MHDFLPDGVYGVDPRNGEATLFNESGRVGPTTTPRARRFRREHHRQTSSPAHLRRDTTEIIDTAELSDGFTFINENLYPIVPPRVPAHPRTTGLLGDGGHSLGLHFIQWTSSYTTTTGPSSTREDRRSVVLDRLAAFEHRLLTPAGLSGGRAPRFDHQERGRLVGGSLNHPHQQIVLSNACLGGSERTERFRRTHRRTFAGVHAPTREPLRAHGRQARQTGRFMVPYFMRRPYNLLYALDDLRPSRLSETSAAQRRDLGLAMAMGMRMTQVGLDLLDREEAYNVVFHSGPGTGMYLEFLPRSQEDGGFEQLGLSACQSSPFLVARALREVV